MRLAYLSSPYTNIDPAVQERRCLDAARAVVWLIGKKYYTISPIIHHHHLTVEGFPLGREAAFSLNLTIMERCDLIIVLCIYGWISSKGVNQEISLARDLNKPVMFLIPEADRTYRLSSVPY